MTEKQLQIIRKRLMSFLYEKKLLTEYKGKSSLNNNTTNSHVIINCVDDPYLWIIGAFPFATITELEKWTKVHTEWIQILHEEFPDIQPVSGWLH